MFAGAQNDPARLFSIVVASPSRTHSQEETMTIMSRRIARVTRFITDYRFYREKGYTFKAAWNLASMTLP